MSDYIMIVIGSLDPAWYAVLRDACWILIQKILASKCIKDSMEPVNL